jgi:hypothetical protein
MAVLPSFSPNYEFIASNVISPFIRYAGKDRSGGQKTIHYMTPAPFSGRRNY